MDGTEVPDWRIGAVRDTSVSETARSLIRQGYCLEARAVLDDWELEFPMSKLTGDFVPVEASLFMRLGDYRRAAAVLAAYCRTVQLTNYLAEALETAFACMRRAGEDRDAMEAFAREMEKKYKHHPIGRQAARLRLSLTGG